MKMNLKSGLLWRRIWVTKDGLAFLEENKIPALKPYQLEVKENRFIFSMDAKKIEGKFFFHGENLILILSGFVYFFTPVAELAVLPEEGEDEVLSDLPGKVLRILVKEGFLVEKESPLLILEAMKMEHTISAKKKALVKEIHVKEGQLVQEGDLLISLESV